MFFVSHVTSLPVLALVPQRLHTGVPVATSNS